MTTTETILPYYRDRLTRYGDTVEAVGWNAENQAKRFALLTQGWDFSQPRQVVDVGCGRGDLYDWFCEQVPRAHVRYRGMDVMPEFVALANQKGLEGAVWVGDAETDELPACDYAVASGIFNLDLGDAGFRSARFMETVLVKMWAVCQRGMAFDCLDHLRTDRIDGQWYADRSKVMGWLTALRPSGTITRWETETVVGNLIVQVNRKEG